MASTAAGATSQLRSAAMRAVCSSCGSRAAAARVGPAPPARVSLCWLSNPKHTCRIVHPPTAEAVLRPLLQAPPLPRRRCSAAAAARASHSAEQLTLAAERLSSVRCRELLAACCVELLKAALAGSAPPASGSGSGGADTPEALLDALHASLQSSLQDAAHSIAPQHHEAWAESQWEGFQEAQVRGGGRGRGQVMGRRRVVRQRCPLVLPWH